MNAAERPTPRQIIIKMPKVKQKKERENLKGSKKKITYYIQGDPI